MISKLTQLHENPRLIAAAQNPYGKFLVWISASALLLWHEVPGILIVETLLQDTLRLMIGAIALVMICPAQRRIILSGTSALLIMNYAFGYYDIDFVRILLTPTTIETPDLVTSLTLFTGIIAILYGTFGIARMFHRLPSIVQQHPFAFLNGLVLVVFLIASLVLTLQAYALLIGMIPYFLWRTGYVFLQAKKGQLRHARFTSHFYTLAPVYGGEVLPIGKGNDYLTRHEGTTAEAFARSQLAGLKLLVLGYTLFWINELIYVVVYGSEVSFLSGLFGSWSFGLSLLTEDVTSATSGSLGVAWFSMYCEFIRYTLETACWGALYVGCVRLLGFNVFRNTYRPLMAESILEFWNRFAYYFKELCVDFFFYPVFLGFAWVGPQARLFLAIFAAAFFGNMYFHMLFYSELFILHDFAKLWAIWGPRNVYCFLLAMGIWVSMIRQPRRRREEAQRSINPMTRLRRMAFVCTYMSYIHIWIIENPEIGFRERFDLSLSLIGL